MRGWQIVAPALITALPGCAEQERNADRSSVIAAIQKAEEAQAAALGKGDLEEAITVFSDDGVLYMPGMPPARGHEAIKAVNERSLKDPALNVTIDEKSRKWWIAASGDLATTTYRYAWTHTDAVSGKPITEQVFAQTTWTKQADGSWKNVSDFNAVNPASERAKNTSDDSR